jgi:hypothetical protein
MQVLVVPRTPDSVRPCNGRHRLSAGHQQHGDVNLPAGEVCSGTGERLGEVPASQPLSMPHNRRIHRPDDARIGLHCHPHRRSLRFGSSLRRSFMKSCNGYSYRYFHRRARSLLRLTPPKSSAHTSAAVTAHRVEVLGALGASVAHFVPGLQLRFRLVDRLPTVAAVARPTAAVPCCSGTRCRPCPHRRCSSWPRYPCSCWCYR